MELLGSSGTHDVVDESLTPEFTLRIVKTAGTVWNINRAAIVRDTRAMGKVLVNAAKPGLASVGIDVDDLGVVSAPTAVRYCEDQAVPGVIITVSHDPPEFNGAKFAGDDDIELVVEELECIEDHILAEKPNVTEWDAVGNIRSVETANDDYHEDLLVSADHEEIAAANLTAVPDPGRDAGSFAAPDFLRKLGCEVYMVSAQPDGHLPGRQSEPIPENLRDLERLVHTTDADVGVVYDGDADRAVFVDERGECISGEASLATLAAAALEPGDMTVSAVNAPQHLTDVCEEVGTDLGLMPIGAMNLITRIRELWHEGRDIPVAGEGSGGVFCPNHRLVRDGAYIAAEFLELVTERSVNELIAPYEDYCDVHINFEYNEEAELTAMLNVAANCAEPADTIPSTTNGYRLGYDST